MKMTSSELFQFLSEKLPTVEYLIFKWSGGGDDWTGYEFIKGKNETGEFTEFPLSNNTEIQKEMNSFIIFDEMGVSVSCAGGGYCKGFLLIALKPLTDDLELYDESWDECYAVERNLKGFAIHGVQTDDIRGELVI
jgi:hypothetical protein